jgi:hypothetical protein
MAIAMHRGTQLQPVGPFINFRDIKVRTGGTIKEGTELVRFTVPAHHPEFTMKGNITHQIVLDESRYQSKVTNNKAAGNLLMELYDFVNDEVVKRLLPFFP